MEDLAQKLLEDHGYVPAMITFNPQGTDWQIVSIVSMAKDSDDQCLMRIQTGARAPYFLTQKHKEEDERTLVVLGEGVALLGKPSADVAALCKTHGARSFIDHGKWREARHF